MTIRCKEKMTRGGWVSGVWRVKLFRILPLFALIMTPSGCSRSEYAEFDGCNSYDMVEQQLAFGTRIPGSEASLSAGDWIISQLEENGWEVEEQVFDYHGVLLRNITGKWEPMPDSRDPILLGAHYDTRPLADRDPISPDLPVPGANDGASGVAVLLELSRVLGEQDYPLPVWLVFFDGEDSGSINGWEWIAGSRKYAEELTIEPVAVVVVDMVGDSDLNLYYEYNSDTALAAEIWQTAAELGYEQFIPELKHSILDDHLPFLQRGLPAVDIIDFDFPAWHTTGDTIDKVSAESLEAVGRTLEGWLWKRSESAMD